MKLPFNITDGATTRLCDYSDLFIICEFNLKFDIYNKGTIVDQKTSNDVLYFLYGAIRALKEAGKMYPMSYLDVLIVVDYHKIASITCLDLHSWKLKPLVRLRLQLDG